MIVLHIGLHKVGSSTIQRFAAEKADVLAANGVHYPREGRGESDAHHDLVMALREPGSTDALDAVAALVESRPDDTFFFSSEGLSTLRAPHVARLVAALRRRHRLRVLLYIRNSVDTVVSAYNQTAKRGNRIASFDTFYAERANGRELLDHLRNWGEEIGYDAIRVRSIVPTALAGGDLLTDLCRALRLRGRAIRALEPATFEAANTRVPWEAAEYVREFTRRSAEMLGTLDPASHASLVAGVPLCRLTRTIAEAGRHVPAIRFGEMTEICVDAALKAGAGAPAQYLTPEQAAHLDARYREQLAEIAALVPDAKLDHVAPKALPQRPFEPQFTAIAPHVLAAMKQAIDERIVPERLPAPLRDIFREMHPGSPVSDAAAAPVAPARRTPGITDPAERERRRQRREAREAKATQAG